jgi:hypothetical protein
MSIAAGNQPLPRRAATVKKNKLPLPRRAATVKKNMLPRPPRWQRRYGHLWKLHRFQINTDKNIESFIITKCIE